MSSKAKPQAQCLWGLCLCRRSRVQMRPNVVALRHRAVERRERPVSTSQATLWFQLPARKTQALGRFSSGLKTVRTHTAGCSHPLSLTSYFSFPGSTHHLLVCPSTCLHTHGVVLVNWFSACMFLLFDSLVEENLTSVKGLQNAHARQN